MFRVFGKHLLAVGVMGDLDHGPVDGRADACDDSAPPIVQTDGVAGRINTDDANEGCEQRGLKGRPVPQHDAEGGMGKQLGLVGSDGCQRLEDITDLEQCIRIRTGETGSEAIG